ncbi:hypothetical protein BDV32DRAFT_89512 [Aspergillus pseudonomiae]|nr:hypothetical protein BDV32DRAFT_89512 [Aspergillus pseudonomiae]
MGGQVPWCLGRVTVICPPPSLSPWWPFLTRCETEQETLVPSSLQVKEVSSFIFLSFSLFCFAFSSLSVASSYGSYIDCVETIDVND